VIGNPGHNPARVTHSFPGRSKIWDLDFFRDYQNLRSGDYREW
jgi:hypothetical protein